jgi:hypothetical protein
MNQTNQPIFDQFILTGQQPLKYLISKETNKRTKKRNLKKHLTIVRKCETIGLQANQPQIGSWVGSRLVLWSNRTKRGYAVFDN